MSDNTRLDWNDELAKRYVDHYRLGWQTFERGMSWHSSGHVFDDDAMQQGWEAARLHYRLHALKVAKHGG